MPFNAKTQGFTLVELLVAMLLGVTLLFGVTQLFSSGRESVRLQSAMASIQDGGRVAMEILSRDIRNADYSGCLRDRDELVNGLQGFAAGSFSEYFDLEPVDGATAGNATKVGSLTVINGTDTLQLVSAQPVCEGVFGLAADQSASSDALTLSAACSSGIDNGTALLVTNCQSGEIFLKTGGTGTAIEHNSSYATTTEPKGISNSSASFREAYGIGSTILEPQVYTYFVSLGNNGTNNALYRRHNNLTHEMVPNVVDFQVEFGIDSDGDLTAEQFVDPTAVVDPEQIIAVRTTLQVESIEQIQGNSVTRTFTATTNIRNRSAPAG